MLQHGVSQEDMEIVHVPGSFELPVAAKTLLKQRNCDAIICLGCVIKGDTEHDQFINQAISNSIAQLGIISGKPITFGVLTVNTAEQATERAGGKHGNKGIESAITAIKMVHMQKTLSQPSGQNIGFG